MVLLINSDINKYIPAKSVKYNVCYFKYNVCYFKYAYKNYNWGICLNGHFSPKKVSPICECLGSIPGILKFTLFGFSLSPTMLFLLQVCINLYYIFFLFADFIFICV